MNNIKAMNFYPYNYDGEKMIDGNTVVVNCGGRHLCGYCAIDANRIPKEWQGDYNQDGLQYLKIHGGITFCEIHDGIVVFGFDCAHAHDDQNPDLRDPNVVMAMAKDMLRKITQYADQIDNFRNGTIEERCAILDKINSGSKEEIGFGAIIDVLCGCSKLKEGKMSSPNLPLPDRLPSCIQEIRQNLGLAPDDPTRDDVIARMSREEQLERYLTWRGIIGFSEPIKNAISEIYEVELKETH